MKCPICSVALKKDIYHGTELSSCSRCGGFWIEPGPLKRLWDSIKPDTGPPARRGHEFFHATEFRRRAHDEIADNTEDRLPSLRPRLRRSAKRV
jgi:Zn-finger nucleic acid-binding protein